MDRRAFLKTSLGVTAGLAAASLPWTGKPALAGPSTRTLRLYNVNNRERLSIEYVVDGWYNPDAQQILDEFLRDWRTHEVHPIDSQLLDYVFAVANELNFENHVNVVSAFRSRSTNNRLVRSNGAARPWICGCRGFGLGTSGPLRSGCTTAASVIILDPISCTSIPANTGPGDGRAAGRFRPHPCGSVAPSPSAFRCAPDRPVHRLVRIAAPIRIMPTDQPALGWSRLNAGCSRGTAAGETSRSITLAEESTPGTPAPGWVPAPTR